MGPVVEVWDTEEKGSDVNLATYLLVDAFNKDFEQAVMISNDSDLALPVRMVRDQFHLPVGAVNAAHQVVGRYNGRAENIWNDNPKAGDLQAR